MHLQSFNFLQNYIVNHNLLLIVIQVKGFFAGSSGPEPDL